LFFVPVEKRSASEWCPQSGLGTRQAWLYAGEIYRLFTEQGIAQEQCCFGRCLESGMALLKIDFALLNYTDSRQNRAIK
jgi:hypothetical protein